MGEVRITFFVGVDAYVFVFFMLVLIFIVSSGIVCHKGMKRLGVHMSPGFRL